MIILANLYNENTGDCKSVKAHSYDEFHRQTFSPEYTVTGIFDTGKSPVQAILNNTLTAKKKITKYEAMQTYMRECAHVYWNSCSDGIDFSWVELCEIGNFFERMGKKYGLLKEFRENGVC